MQLSIILPVLNESAVITQVLDDFQQYCLGHGIAHEIIVVDDGSTDNTAASIRNWNARHHPVRLIQHHRNLGYGSALRTGFAAASGDYIFLTDADGQFRADDLGKTFFARAPKSMVLGYRTSRADSATRRITGTLWSGLVGLLFGFRVRDLNCAWKLFPRSLIHHHALKSQGAFISAEIVLQAQRNNLQQREIPVQHFSRTSGQPTGLRPKVIVRAAGEMITYAFTPKRRAADQSPATSNETIRRASRIA